MSGDDFAFERSAVEVLDEKLDGRAEVRERQLVLGRSACDASHGTPACRRAEPRAYQEKSPSVHVGATLPHGSYSLTTGGSMQISARNQLRGTVTSITLGGVMAEIVIRSESTRSSPS